MKGFFRKIGLVDNVSIELPVRRDEFLKTLRIHVDEPGGELFEVFSNSKNDYKGRVSHDTFDIRKRRRLFDSRLNFARAAGRVSGKDDSTIIDVELTGYSPLVIPFFVFLFLVYGFVIASILFQSDGFLWTIPLVVLHALFMIGIPYIVMRKSMSRIRYDMERDFFFMIRRSLSPTNPSFL
jgi:hypothetical protein